MRYNGIEEKKLNSHNNNIILGNQATIRSTDNNNCYKCIGILVVDTIKHQEMKRYLEKIMHKTAKKDLEIKVELRQPGGDSNSLSGAKNEPNRNLRI